MNLIRQLSEDDQPNRRSCKASHVQSATPTLTPTSAISSQVTLGICFTELRFLEGDISIRRGKSVGTCGSSHAIMHGDMCRLSRISASVRSSRLVTPCEADLIRVDDIVALGADNRYEVCSNLLSGRSTSKASPRLDL